MKKRSEDRMDFSEQMARGEEYQSTTVALPPGVSRFKLDGTKSKRIDIIPYIVGEGNPDADPGQKFIYRTFYQHRGIGPDNRAYICLWETYKKKCPICEERNRLRNEDPDDEMAKKLKPSKRQLWNVIDVDNPDAGIQIWDVSHFYFGEQLYVAVQSSDEDEGHKYFADVDNGFTLKLTVEQGSSGTKNDLKISRVDFRPRKKQYGKSIIKEAVCLDELLKPLSYKELKQVFLQSDEEEDDDSGSSSSSKKGKKMKRKMNAKKKGIEKGSTVNHPELGECIVTAVAKDGFTVTLKDEDDDVHKNIDVAALEVEGAEEDEAPKKRGRGRPKGSTSKKKSKDEDDDDDDDSDDDSDDEDDEESDDDDDSDSDDDDDESEDDDSELDDDDEDSDDEDLDDDEEDSDDEDDEEEEPKPKRGKAKPKAKPKKGRK